MKRFLLVTLCGLIFAIGARADEGMWLPSLIGRQIKQLNANGLKLTADDLYSVNKASLKDAIMLFGSGCTGELVSNQGLLLTNHHCGYGQIQNHSSVEHDYLTDGFWAMNKSEELPNSGLTVSFLVRMDDVSEQVFEGTSDSQADSVRRKIIKTNIDKIKKEATKDTHYSASVESLYYGNQYFIFIYEVFKDVRLVAAPPSSIGKFGGDTDNWMWPRHTGDFSIFRIYADKNNKPAGYSKDNVPYRPKKHFSISSKGVKEGDFTFVYGFPGKTSRYVTSDAVDYLLNMSNPVKIRLRTQRLDIMNNEQAKDVATRIMYASKNASVANSWKKWQGESKGVARLGTIDKKRAQEVEFERWAADKPQYADLLPRMRAVYAELNPCALAVDYYREAIDAIELVKFAGQMTTASSTENAVKSANAFYKDYSGVIDRRIAKVMLAEYMANMPKDFIPIGFADTLEKQGGVEPFVDMIFDNSSLVTAQRFGDIDTASFASVIAEDPAVVLYQTFKNVYSNKMQGKFQKLTAQITALYSDYMRALMEMQPDRNFYPDANLTLRIASGSVAGYKPRDGETHTPISTLDGIIEKDDPAIYDYDIPQRLRELYAAKDYGRWRSGTSVPVAFIATNHTTGGNSGSPVLNANGELIGLNFDRTWLSTMSDIEFDPTMCRNIAVDIRYVLFVIEKLGGAGYLLDEMTIK